MPYNKSVDLNGLEIASFMNALMHFSFSKQLKTEGKKFLSKANGLPIDRKMLGNIFNLELLIKCFTILFIYCLLFFSY